MIPVWHTENENRAVKKKNNNTHPHKKYTSTAVISGKLRAKSREQQFQAISDTAEAQRSKNDAKVEVKLLPVGGKRAYEEGV